MVAFLCNACTVTPNMGVNNWCGLSLFYHVSLVSPMCNSASIVSNFHHLVVVLYRRTNFIMVMC